MLFHAVPIVMSLALSALASPTPRATSAVDAATTFLNAYSSMDYDALKAAATTDYHFQDQAFPHLANGDDSLAMFHWFIHDQPTTKMIVTVDKVEAGDDANTVNAHYTADYYFDAGFGNVNHVVNPISTVITVEDGLVATQTDTYDEGFSGWAAQALGPVLGPLLKDSPLTLPGIQAAGTFKLKMFQMTNPS